MKRIVLTGGPGAGKTVVSRWIVAQHPDRFILSPEAATQIYQTHQTRWDKLDSAARREIQRQIYQLQIAQEERLAKQHPDRVLILDRGTVDGAAYWPEGAEAYWAAMGTTHRNELQRYDSVFWLESCAALGLYDGEHSNPCRFEDAATAIRSGQDVLMLWKDHPHLIRIPATQRVEDKMAEVMRHIQ